MNNAPLGEQLIERPLQAGSTKHTCTRAQGDPKMMRRKAEEDTFGPEQASAARPLKGLGLAALCCLAALALCLSWPPRDQFRLDGASLADEPEERGEWPAPAPAPPVPKREIVLLTYEQFAAAYRTLASELPSELAFLGELLEVARHNLATLSGAQTYYRRQSPFKLELATMFASSNWPELEVELSDGLVGHPAAELRRANLLGKWLNQLTKSEADFEIPSWPLSEQPDPERVTHIDADLRACTDSIKDQRACGACYAFSWLSLAEWHYCRQLNESRVVDFSEQHIVDCGRPARLNGCVEGRLSDAKDFSRVFGIHLERDYPYSSKRGPCKSQQGSLELQVNDFKRIQVERKQFERTLSEQPILLEVHLPQDIGSYSSGIHPGTNCDPRLGHGMLLVGHGRQSGRPYWLLRNSMGKRWGENGYLRLARDMPQMGRCFRSAFIGKFKFKELGEEPYLDFYDSLQFQDQLVDVPANRSSSSSNLA